MNQESAPTASDVPPESLAEASVVLRVEVATLTLPVERCAALVKGDVVTTGTRLGELVVLRAGGVIFARGELCDLEGELAVRIVDLLGEKGSG